MVGPVETLRVWFLLTVLLWMENLARLAAFYRAIHTGLPFHRHGTDIKTADVADFPPFRRVFGEKRTLRFEESTEVQRGVCPA